MINWEDIKNSIYGETNKVFSDLTEKELRHLIALYEGILLVKLDSTELKLDGVESRISHSLQVILVDESSKTSKSANFPDFCKIEPFLRKLLYLLNSSKYKRFDEEKRGMSALINAISLNTSNIDLEAIDENDLIKSDLKAYHLVRTYKLRNTESHLCENWSLKELYANIESVLCVYLMAIQRWKSEIEDIISRENILKEQDFTDYLNRVKDEFKERIGKFVHIKGKEDIKLSQNIVIEAKIENGENDRLERVGTVNDLRKNQVPENRMIIWGDAGMGKSTTLEYLAYKDAESRIKDPLQNLPVYVSLGLLTDKNISLKETIYSKLGVENTLGDKLLDDGRVNIFLDAINEIPKDENNQLRSLRLKEIHNILRDYKKTFVILSNRPQEENMFRDVPVFQLQKMNMEQIETFLNKNLDNKSDTKIILREIKADERLQRIIRIPLMLSRLIEIFKVNKEIPKSEGEIIDKFISSLYTREIEEKKDGNFSKKIIHSLLRYLGYESLENKNTNAGMTENEVMNYFLDCKKKYGYTIDLMYVLEIVTHLGIIEKRDNLYTFAHQAYQDYFHSQEEFAILGL